MNCHFLSVSQINCTLMNFADHGKKFGHGAISCYLRDGRIAPRFLVWENVCDPVVTTSQGYVVFDDTVLDKNTSFTIEWVRR